MATDNDLAALMPKAPPPRPARRDAAIEEALRRFDAGGPQAPPVPARARPAPRFEGWGRPQIAASASVALVVLVSVPIWWSRDELVPPDAPPSAALPPPASVAGKPAPLPPQRPAAVIPVKPSTSGPPVVPITVPPAASEPAAVTDASESATLEVNLNRLPISPPPSANARALGQAIGQAIAIPAPAPPPPPPPPSPPPAASKAAAARAEAGEQIVVTGARVSRGDFAANSPTISVNQELLDDDGNWNTCTLDDPRRDVNACRVLADPALRGTAGRAGDTWPTVSRSPGRATSAGRSIPQAARSPPTPISRSLISTAASPGRQRAISVGRSPTSTAPSPEIPEALAATIIAACSTAPWVTTRTPMKMHGVRSNSIRAIGPRSRRTDGALTRRVSRASHLDSPAHTRQSA